jgi:hypothetical protein
MVGGSEGLVSSYFDSYMKLQHAQYETAVSLALIGLVWVVGWLLIGRVIPARFRVAARWYILIMAVFVSGIVLASLRG